MARKLSAKAKKKVVLGVIATVVIGVALIFVTAAIKNNTRAQLANASKPNFQAVLPANTSIEDLGGWQKRTPPNSDPFFVYVDEIDSVLINVSQQQLPNDFKSNVDTKVAEVAKGYNATSVLDANGTKVYIGNNAKGPQSVIFTKNDLLISIVSQQKIQDESWISYINSLE